MKKARIILVAVSLMVFSGASVYGDYVFTDDFNRADGDLGSNWQVSCGGTGTATASIVSNQIEAYASVWGDGPIPLVSCVAENTVLNDNFTVSAKIGMGPTVTYFGFAWQIQDANNYYVIRLKANESDDPMIFKLVDKVYTNTSSYVTNVQGAGTVSFTTDTLYAVTVEQTSAGVYNVSASDGTNTWSATMTNSDYTNGRVGFAGGLTSSYKLLGDDFNLSVVPEPATLALLGTGGSLLLIRRKRR